MVDCSSPRIPPHRDPRAIRFHPLSVSVSPPEDGGHPLIPHPLDPRDLPPFTLPEVASLMFNAGANWLPPGPLQSRQRGPLGEIRYLSEGRGEDTLPTGTPPSLAISTSMRLRNFTRRQ